MPEEPGTLILEVSKHADTLKMSVYEQKDISQTLRHYSQLPVNFREINKLCSDLADVLNKRNSRPELEKTGQLLWDHLLTKPAKEKIRSAVPGNFVLMLEEELIDIPWELLFDGRDFLSLKFSLGRLVKTKESVSRGEFREFNRVPKMLILANPTGDLKSSYLEGAHIKKQFEHKKKEIQIDFKAFQIDTLYVKKNLHDYEIVHFAGHCEYDNKNFRENGWVLTDGKFSIGDIYALGETLSLPAMIFSNACHSAELIQNKAHSMASAFLFSGVRHYIGAIRKIEDSVSLVFAEEFYSRLISGKPVGECLRLARLKLINEFGPVSIDWANYILYGDAGFVMFRSRHKKRPARLRVALPRLRKYAVSSLGGAFLCLMIIFSLTRLPTLNPSAYFLFSKSKRFFQGGKNDESISFAKAAIEKDPLFLEAYPLLAEAYIRQGKREDALKHYFDYALYSSRKNNYKELASAYNSIGWVYQSLGDYPKAMGFYDKALVLSREKSDYLNEAISLRRSAVWYADKEMYDKALELLMKSSEINRERSYSKEHRFNLACDYFDIGLIFADKDDFKTAREFYRKSMKIFDKLKVKNELSDCYFNTGEMFLFEKQYKEASESYFKGLEIDIIHDDKPSLAADYEMIAELYKEMGNPELAEEYLNKSIEVSKSITAPLELAEASFNMGLLYKEKGYRNKALEYLRQAQEIYSRIDTPAYQRIKQVLLE